MPGRYNANHLKFLGTHPMKHKHKLTESDGIETLWTIDDLAARLVRKVSTIYTDMTRAPHKVPPYIQIGGDDGAVRWRPCDVYEWEEAHIVRPTRMTAASIPSSADPTAPKRRGRPRKSDRLARQSAARTTGEQ